uniref:Vesicle transport protein USE1 n=1 Tax=Cacopsylla melanoneura TaxID=428564 RepID=A0A8D8VVA5_9HEMI
MVLSRTEINIKRLLARCEFMVDENNEENNWRIEKYVEGLEDMILTLKKENDEQDQAEDMDKRSEVFSMKQNELDSVLGDEHKVQERIVESMLDMVQNIKQRSVAANQIIKQDIASAEKSSCLADVNQDKMRINNDTLGVFNKGAYKCWLWVMLGFVFITFFYMIMFIKLFKKKS